jgi:Tfp pilus assembly PilM family ATPase
MPRILAIDWDRHEVRGLLVLTGPTGISVAGAWAAPLATSDPAGLSAKQIGGRLAAAMTEPVAGKVTTIVGSGRDQVQMKLLSLPPAPADELPDIVRFQAEREFTALGDDAALDFIPLAGDAQTPHQVLAVALSPAGMTEVRELCQALGVEPDRIVLRVCAAGAAVHRAGIAGTGKVALIVNPLIDEADLAVQSGEQVLLMRTVRLPDPTQADARQRALVGEIRRTLAAARQQLTDRQVDLIVLCGNAAAPDQASGLVEELETPVVMFDAAESAPAGITLHSVPSESLARFAAVLGMALTEADRRAPIVDFANVRRRVEPQRFGRNQILAAAAAAIVVLGLAANMWRQSANAASELAEARNEIQSLQASKTRYDKVTANATAIENWLATDVNWLDELEQFGRRVRPQPFSAKDYPVNEDVVVTQLSMLRPPGLPGVSSVGGRMDLSAVAKSPAAVEGLEKRLVDERHVVRPGIGGTDNSLSGYNWAFGLQVEVLPADDAEASP